MRSSRDFSMPYIFIEKLLALPLKCRGYLLQSTWWCPSVAHCGQCEILKGELAQCCVVSGSSGLSPLDA